jgi:hypothetical protein
MTCAASCPRASTWRPWRTTSAVWQINQQGLEGPHPTPKPLAIVTGPIGYHTEPGAVIYEHIRGRFIRSFRHQAISVLHLA